MEGLHSTVIPEGEGGGELMLRDDGGWLEGCSGGRCIYIARRRIWVIRNPIGALTEAGAKL